MPAADQQQSTVRQAFGAAAGVVLGRGSVRAACGGAGAAGSERTAGKFRREIDGSPAGGGGACVEKAAVEHFVAVSVPRH